MVNKIICDSCNNEITKKTFISLNECVYNWKFEADVDEIYNDSVNKEFCCKKCLIDYLNKNE